MNRSTDVLIIGGGVIGVCCAYYLAQRGRSVTLLDKDDICAGSSYGNAGMIVPSHAIPLAMPGAIRQALPWLLDATSPFYIKPRLNLELLDWLWRFRAASNAAALHKAIPVLIQLNRASLELFRQLASDTNLDFNFVQRGGLYVYLSRAGLEKGMHEAELLHQYGGEAAILDTAGVRELAPAIRPTVIGGIYHHQDAHLTPDRFVHSMANLLRNQGVDICASTEVLACETNKGRVVQVVTTRGDYRPEQVVLAAGAWSSQLARSLGLRLPVQPAKGYSITIARPVKRLDVPLHLAERKVAVTPMGDKLRFAGTLELAGLDLSINRRRVNAIQQAAHEYLDFGNGSITNGPITNDPMTATKRMEPNTVEIWRGLRPLTPDTLPIIGRCRHLANLTVATGHGMMGVSLGPITGKLVAQLIGGEQPELELSPLAVERFA